MILFLIAAVVIVVALLLRARVYDSTMVGLDDDEEVIG